MEAFGGRALVARPGLILGPYERVGRLPWWLRRLERGGRVLCPGPQERPLQCLDARDLAIWLLMAAENRLGGVFNTVSRPGHTTMGELLETARAVTGSTAEFVWVAPAIIEKAALAPWTELPIWVPPDGELAGLHAGDVGRARSRASVSPCGRDGPRHLDVDASRGRSGGAVGRISRPALRSESRQSSKCWASTDDFHAPGHSKRSKAGRYRARPKVGVTARLADMISVAPGDCARQNRRCGGCSISSGIPAVGAGIPMTRNRSDRRHGGLAPHPAGSGPRSHDMNFRPRTRGAPKWTRNQQRAERAAGPAGTLAGAMAGARIIAAVVPIPFFGPVVGGVVGGVVGSEWGDGCGKGRAQRQRRISARRRSPTRRLERNSLREPPEGQSESVARLSSEIPRPKNRRLAQAGADTPLSAPL